MGRAGKDCLSFLGERMYLFQKCRISEQFENKGYSPHCQNKGSKVSQNALKAFDPASIHDKNS
jgi:hypothetical protein